MRVKIKESVNIAGALLSTFHVSYINDYWFGVWLITLTTLTFSKGKICYGGAGGVSSNHPTSQRHLVLNPKRSYFSHFESCHGFLVDQPFFGQTPSARKYWGWSLAPGPHDDTEKKCLDLGAKNSPFTTKSHQKSKSINQETPSRRRLPIDTGAPGKTLEISGDWWPKSMYFKMLAGTYRTSRASCFQSPNFCQVTMLISKRQMLRGLVQSESAAYVGWF